MSHIQRINAYMVLLLMNAGLGHKSLFLQLASYVPCGKKILEKYFVFDDLLMTTKCIHWIFLPTKIPLNVFPKFIYLLAI